MIAIIQRAKSASVKVDGETVGSAGAGFLILLGVVEGDTAAEAELLAAKTVNLRVFCDAQGKMNRSLLDIRGDALVVSNFTLAADVKKGNRPSFTRAAAPFLAEPLYLQFGEALRQLGVQHVETGVFGADMEVSLVGDGPVTITLDTDIWRKRV